MTGARLLVAGVIGVAIIATSVIVYVVYMREEREEEGDNRGGVSDNNRAAIMQLSSQSFGHNETIPGNYTCDGVNINPPLKLEAVPGETRSLVLIMDDPDAPGGTWDHWVVYNIPPETRAIAEGQEPAGVHGVGTSGNRDYSGPCPPDREHRYFFKLFALDTTLDLPAGASKAEVETAMTDHILTQTELIGRYNRK